MGARAFATAKDGTNPPGRFFCVCGGPKRRTIRREGGETLEKETHFHIGTGPCGRGADRLFLQRQPRRDAHPLALGADGHAAPGAERKPVPERGGIAGSVAGRFERAGALRVAGCLRRAGGRAGL